MYMGLGVFAPDEYADGLTALTRGPTVTCIVDQGRQPPILKADGCKVEVQKAPEFNGRRQSRPKMAFKIGTLANCVMLTILMHFFYYLWLCTWAPP